MNEDLFDNLLGSADMLLDIAAEQQYIFSGLPLHAW